LQNRAYAKKRGGSFFFLRGVDVLLSRFEVAFYNLKLVPAICYIFYGEPRHKRMPRLSGLGQSFSKVNLIFKGLDP